MRTDLTETLLHRLVGKVIVAEMAKSDKRGRARCFLSNGVRIGVRPVARSRILRLVYSTRPVSRSKSADGADVPDACRTVLARNDATGSWCSLVERNWIEAWRRTAYLDQVRKDASNLLGLLDNGDDFHF